MRVWVKQSEIEGIKTLLRTRLPRTAGARVSIPVADILPILRKADARRLVWTRAFRYTFRDWGLSCSLRETSGDYLIGVRDLSRWQRALAGEGEPTAAPSPVIEPVMTSEPEDDPLIPASDESYVLPQFADILLKGIEAGERTLLVGPTGSGKSSLVRELAARSRSRFMRINLNGETAVPDLLGQFRINAHREMIFQEGPVPRAMRQGAWLCLDEVDAATPQVLFCLQALLEDGGKLFIPELGEWLVPDSRFRVVLTANTLGKGDDSGLYAGTQVLNEAFLDRIHSVFQIDYLPAEAEVRLLCSRVKRLGAETAERMVRVASDIRRAAKDGTIYTTFSSRRLLAWAHKTIQIGDTGKAATFSILNRLGEDDRRVVAEVLQRHGFGEGA